MLKQPTQDEFQRLAEQVIGILVQEGMLVMQRKIQEAGFVVTGELLNSLRKQSMIVAKDLYAEFSIGFAGYGRFKDMRQLLYTKMPPIDVLEDYVRAIGLENFGYVPGYRKDAKFRVYITDSRAVNRIAWGIAMNRRKEGVTGGRKKAFYNPTRGRLVYQVRDRIMEALPPEIMKGLKRELESN